MAIGISFRCFCGERNCDCDFSNSPLVKNIGRPPQDPEEMRWVTAFNTDLRISEIQVVMDFRQLEIAAKKFGYRLVRE